jgi:hypothetical protein
VLAVVLPDSSEFGHEFKRRVITYVILRMTGDFAVDMGVCGRDSPSNRPVSCINQVPSQLHVEIFGGMWLLALQSNHLIF